MSSLLSASQDQDDWQFYANSVCLSPDGSVVFGSSDGCKFMPPQAMNTDFLRTYVGTHASKMLNIFGLEVKNQEGKVLAVTDEVSRLSRYTFTYDENDLKFSFYYPSFSRRSALMCQYRLEGYDKDWQAPTYECVAHYSNLAPGKYTFHLRLISSMNRPALAERKIEIIIKPAPWWSSAAWLLYFGIIVFVLYTFNRL